MRKPKNCDGCAANMEVREVTMLGNTVKMHYHNNRSHMVCTAARYQKVK